MTPFRALLAALLVSSLLIAPSLAAGSESRPVKDKPVYCPLDGKSKWDARGLMYRRVSVATRIAARHGCSVRIAVVNGRVLPQTADLVFSRINVSIRGKQRRIVGLGIG